MKITKIYCDCCNKEVRKQNELYVYPLLDTLTFLHTGKVEISDREVCEDCFNKLSLEFDKLRDESEEV